MATILDKYIDIEVGISDMTVCWDSYSHLKI